MTKKKIFFLLLLLSVGWIGYRNSPIKIEHEGYTFLLPDDFDEAVAHAGLKKISPRMAVSYDDRGWLLRKAISDYPRFPKKIFGMNVYYDDSVDIKAVMHRIEENWGEKFQSSRKIFPEDPQAWWFIETDDITILVYSHSPYLLENTHNPLPDEKNCMGKGQGKQWVVAYTHRLYIGESASWYARNDGIIGDRYDGKIFLK